MATSPLSPHLANAEELRARFAAERAGTPFLVYRDAEGRQHLHPLDGDSPITVGRDPDCTVSMPWDSHISGLHAELSRLGRHWIVADDGLSTNGTFVNHERVVGRRRLHDRDEIEIGEAAIVFLDPEHGQRKTTLAGTDAVAPEVSPAQRRVLVALCRPFRDELAFARPASNRQIADELQLTVAAVKTHLRQLFQRFEVDGLPQNEKRQRLVQVALESGAVAPSDLERP